jgi:hypothetical protein
VKIHGLEIECAGNQEGVKTESSSTTTLDEVEIHGCAHNGAVEMKGGRTTVTRSNLHDNPGGAIHTDGTADFAVTNNFIHHNGSGTVPAVNIGANPARPEARFEFNTVIDNQAVLATTPPLSCAKASLAPNNIIARNGGVAPAAKNCVVTGSLVTEDVGMLDMPLEASADYHIGPASIAKDTAPDGSSLADDIDGEFRPQGTGKDYGADEYRP